VAKLKSRPDFPIGVRNGLLSHYPKMREAVWLFLFLIDRETHDRRAGSKSGKVLGGMPVCDSDITEALGGASTKTISRWRKVLVAGGYIEATRTPYGFSYRVLNSKKWLDETRQKCPVSEPERSDTLGKRSDTTGVRSDTLGESNKRNKRQQEREGGASLSVESEEPAEKATDSDFKTKVMFDYLLEMTDRDPEKFHFSPEMENRILRQWEKLLATRNGDVEAAKKILSYAIYGFGSSDFHNARGKHAKRQKFDVFHELLDCSVSKLEYWAEEGTRAYQGRNQ
jgi:hypothetical protein